MTTQAGNNRTGIKAHPQRSQNMLKGMESYPPTSAGSAKNIADIRVEEARRAGPVGSVAAPRGREATPEIIAFLDSLGGRLAFERSAVRLYEALLSKHQAYGGFEGGPKKADIEAIRGQELTHVALLTGAIRALGGDPTQVTPSASLGNVMVQSAVTVLADPRTTLYQGLEVMVVAELADTECWEMLIDLAIDNGQDEMSEQFAAALIVENEHLDKIRRWLAEG